MVSIFINGESCTLNITEKNQYLFLVSSIFFAKQKISYSFEWKILKHSLTHKEGFSLHTVHSYQLSFGFTLEQTLYDLAGNLFFLIWRYCS